MSDIKDIIEKAKSLADREVNVWTPNGFLTHAELRSLAIAVECGEIAQKVVEHYADASNWGDLETGSGDIESNIVYTGECPPYQAAAGYDFAAEALEQIRLRRGQAK